MDELKKLINVLPEIEPKRSSRALVAEVIKRELLQFWERRLSFFLGGLCLGLGILAAKQAGQIASLLDLKGFLGLLSSNRSWLIDEPLVVLMALVETLPLAQIGYLSFLLAIFVFLLYLWRKNE
jgi:hypothetical protein